MLQHTSSEVIIIQLQINLNSKIQLYGLGTNEIDRSLPKFSFKAGFRLRINRDSLILQCMSDRLVANISK